MPTAGTVPDRYENWVDAAVTALRARGDANSLATAAALRFFGSAGTAKTAAVRADALELAARAVELAPQNPSIAWLHLQLCSNTSGCDIRDAATAMRWEDADNGAAWLRTLAAAEKDRDAVEVNRVLTDMAQAAHFDFYWNRIVAMMNDALSAVRHGLPPGIAAAESARLALVTGVAAAEIVAPFAPLSEACREPGNASERRDLCIKVARTMQRGDTVAAQLAGFATERRLHAPDSKEARALAERRRVLEWRYNSAAQYDSPLLPWVKNARARIRLAHMRAMAREEDVCLAILREHRAVMDPPEVR